MKRIVVKISGNTFNLGPRGRSLKPYIRLLRDTHSKGMQPLVVAGGGAEARRFITAARRMGADEAILDSIGIDVARLNAKILLAGLGRDAYPTIPKNLDEAAHAAETGKIVVIGGFHPGHSTNAVAALVAERTRADLLINATDVDGVWSADPKIHKDARRLVEVTVTQLTKMLSEGSMEAGGYELIDLVALRIIARSKLRTRIVRCTPRILADAIQGKPTGTLILA